MTTTTSAGTVARAGTPASEGNRRLDIQGLRAVAVLMVVAFHAKLPVPGGFVGVDVFFVISGFVITAMLMREWGATGRIQLVRFYVRRFKRLIPALALTVAVVMLLSAVLLSPMGSQQVAVKTGIGAMLLAANVIIARTTGDYFDGPAEGNPLLNLWSLSVEEQFYLVFPAILLAGWIIGKRLRRPVLSPVAVVSAVGVVSFALMLLGSAGISIPMLPESLVGFYGPATRAWEFAVGALLALGGRRFTVRSPRAGLALSVLGAGMLLASLWRITAATPFPGPWTTVPVIGTLLLLAGGSSTNVVGRALASAPMIAIGDRSYSLYLWHWPLIVFAQVLWPDQPLVPLVAAVVSVVPAWASYRWVEQPIRAANTDGAARMSRLVAAVVIPPLALAGALGVAANAGFWTPAVQRYQSAVLPPHEGAAKGCTRETWLSPEKCTWNAAAEGDPIYLVGDSNADHFTEALTEVSAASDRPLVGLSEDGCPYLFITTQLDEPRTDERCDQYPGNASQTLRNAEPGLVVIANSYLWFRESSGSAVGAVGEVPSLDNGERLRALSTGLTTAVAELKRSGHAVLIVQAVPHWGDQKDAMSWDRCTALDMVMERCSHTMSAAEVNARQGAIAEVVASVAQEIGASFLDLSEELCPDGTCSSVSKDGLIRYRDGTHITVDQSRALTETFQRAIAAIG